MTSMSSSAVYPLPAVIRTHPRVLSIAGSDPSGGAGIQADLKSIAAHGGYGMAAITALTAQNTRGVSGVHVPPVEFLRQQLETVSSDVAIDAVKIGMLGDAAVINEVRTWLAKVRSAVVVLDPVMVATSGDRLLRESAEAALRDLLPMADLITPNLPELAMLLGEPEAQDWPAALDQGKRLAGECGNTVLVKGGHLPGAHCPDALINTSGLLRQDVIEVGGPRVQTRNSHGTGCSLSSALATVQARTGDWEASLREVKPWLREALIRADDLEVGQGSGPIHHFHHLGETSRPGAFAALLWKEAAVELEAIHGLAFIRDLGSGELPESEFSYYLAQDALYLNGYSRVLARAGALAPTEEEQLFWARGSQQCLDVESELHRNWLSGREATTQSGPVTKAYVDHLMASSASGSYGVLLAAVLPCYWLYAEVGQQLHANFVQAGSPENHPYADWLRTYADEDFAEATRKAIALTDAAAAAASGRERGAMKEAFVQSCRYETAFFDAPRLYS
ncbi:bifunctional hydroxymethylpyrimidine kinase/phosphomethylpyrimidine kinase [Paenarthrobacter ureafaciens]|uniref:bifunctional hydroxymethylpyrimidine kinase/phosphomethylpyrimidine kinase n=1 Tax=Paenarthrobacter ureafaciens TaxID=37931 RepID=UPI00140A6207|nr:bifunctional hydroxymethylpyrimidine kinase/phosphomethylpyrimidine kinase [Paenarthrobacter ureafaciens]MCX8453037.1 bifunctional hydroxymethylpyrimidine kinase/phosphomethylpyrimidine kinase [Paenarthrobacter ureafaciens]MCY0971675.1 bifunctional hydroxymethylpyrimidine kinase/phosphomethylpyrimidine kinase [Paenarthrobacter ureafaciens]